VPANQKMKFLGRGFQKLEHKQDRQTDRQIDRQTGTTNALLAT